MNLVFRLMSATGTVPEKMRQPGINFREEPRPQKPPVKTWASDKRFIEEPGAIPFCCNITHLIGFNSK
jgi:hypothetical protein